MSSEKERILKLLEAEKISAEEAVSLIKAMSENKEKTSNEFHDIAADTIKNIVGFVKSISDKATFGQHNRGNYRKHQSHNIDVGEGVDRMVMSGLNGGLSITVHNEERLVILAECESSVEKTNYVLIKEENNQLLVRPIDDEVTGLEIVAKIPKRYYESVALSTINGKIVVNNLSSRDLIVKTSNAKINCTKCDVKEAHFTTSNAEMQITDCTFEIMSSNTSNGDIRLESEIKNNCIIETKTSNGDIDIVLEGEDLNKTAFVISVESTDGQVMIDVPNLAYTSRKTKDADFAEVKSQNMDNAKHKVIVNAKTSNGSIQITNQI